MSEPALKRLSDVALAYERTNLAYLHLLMETLAQKCWSASHEHVRLVLASLRDTIPTSKEEAISGCLEAASRVPIGTPEEAGLLPPLFIAACLTECPDQTWFTLERAEGIASTIGVGNMHRVTAVIRELWVRRVQLGGWRDWRSLITRSNWDLIVT